MGLVLGNPMDSHQRQPKVISALGSICGLVMYGGAATAFVTVLDGQASAASSSWPIAMMAGGYAGVFIMAFLEDPVDSFFLKRGIELKRNSPVLNRDILPFWDQVAIARLAGLTHNAPSTLEKMAIRRLSTASAHSRLEALQRTPERSRHFVERHLGPIEEPPEPIEPLEDRRPSLEERKSAARKLGTDDADYVRYSDLRLRRLFRMTSKQRREHLKLIPPDTRSIYLEELDQLDRLC